MNASYHPPPPPPPQGMGTQQGMAQQQMPGGYVPPPVQQPYQHQQQPPPPQHQHQHHVHQQQQQQHHQHQQQHHHLQHQQPPSQTPLSQQHQQQHPHPPQHQQHGLPPPHPHPHPHPHSLPHSHQVQQQHPLPHAQGHQLQHPPPQAHEPPHVELLSENNESPQSLVPICKVDEASGRKYFLEVRQQPKRARMCGFGDKDRRPITPPPCVRLVITDIATGKEIDCNDIDYTKFVLCVDLWTETASKEVNLVRSSQNTPSISSTTPVSYTALNGGDAVSYTQQMLPSGHEAVYSQPPPVGYVQDYPPQSGFPQMSPSYPPNNSYGPAQQYYPQQQQYRPGQGLAPLPSQANIAPYSRDGAPIGYGQDQGSSTRMAMAGGQPTGMFSRNLIGSLVSTAFRLNDENDRIGIWFVLQDLSVRTEGAFRLRFSFVNVGPQGGVPQDEGASQVTHGRVPIQASSFSEPFTVYSAKKFPGVCESTDLSKTFASQGIKIPIRKEANAKGGDDDEYGD